MSGYDNLNLFNESKDKNAIDEIVDKLNMKEYIHKKQNHIL